MAGVIKDCSFVYLKFDVIYETRDKDFPKRKLKKGVLRRLRPSKVMITRFILFPPISLFLDVKKIENSIFW